MFYENWCSCTWWLQLEVSPLLISLHNTERCYMLPKEKSKWLHYLWTFWALHHDHPARHTHWCSSNISVLSGNSHLFVGFKALTMTSNPYLTLIMRSNRTCAPVLLIIICIYMSVFMNILTYSWSETNLLIA